MLSQQEIDALLSGAIEIEGNEGEERVNLAELIGSEPGAVGKSAKTKEGKKVQPYNFWSPNRFSKEQMRAVELVHEDLAERLTTSLPTFLRFNLRPRLVHTEQGRFHDFLKDSGAGTLFHMITLAPLPGQIVLTISPNVSLMILEQRLGGRIEGQVQERDLTDIDQSLLRGLVEHMLNDLKGAWSKVASIEPALEDSTVNSNWVQMMMGTERVMLLTFELTLMETTGTMSVFIPFRTLKPIANELNPHVWISGRKEQTQDPAVRENAMKSLSNVKLPVKVIMGSANLTVREVLELSVGDVIRLDTGVEQLFKMQIANQTLFNVRIGKANNRLVAKVHSVARDEE
ncbi:hypothetical protein ADN00_17215 [Ornatilinea apprima]|uniref:Flagellar motor switch protein FliM n=1 Tax=Ornatilinea apprima TaxID=1134406 RepID=A0A0P6WYA7_9CHLR|nr:flagellar motor switch protein FliM [Ornatilinea apprima]KPL71428.1 hypothetical protein ADN00_17215 [Ornatilinea apprima]